MEMKPCRDCGTPVQSTSRSCPHCGIMNPVHKWVALPDGEDEKFRVPVNQMSAMMSAARTAAILQRPPKTFFGRVFGSVDDAEDAKEAIDWCTAVLFIQAALHLLAGFVGLGVGMEHFVQAGLLGGAATWLRMTQSRAAAVVVLILAGLSLFLAALTFSIRTGWIALIAAGLAWRAFNGTRILAAER